MTRLGIIPAGGKASRFGGTMKEMLPCDEHTLLDHCVAAMACGGATEITLLTTVDKIAIHARQLQGRHVTYRISAGSIWASLEDLFNVSQHDRYLFAMPDTFFPYDCFDRPMDNDFTLGLFTTFMPSRFGVLHEGCIWDKYFESGEYKAWGVLSWTKNVVEFWKKNNHSIKDFTQAFNLAMDEFGYSTFDLAYYYDMASFNDYKAFMVKHE